MLLSEAALFCVQEECSGEVKGERSAEKKCK